MTDRELLQHIERSPASRVGYKQLVREFGLGGGRDRRLLLEHLARLTASGQLIKLDREQWGIARRAETRDNLIAGRLDLHRDGFGFVRVPGDKSSGQASDIFIPPPEINGAMPGDQVLVELAPGRRGADADRRQGRIVRVLTRRNPTIVGIFHYAKNPRQLGHQVVAFDEKLTQPILIPFDEPLPEPRATLRSPHRVLGEEAQLQIAEYPDLEGLVVDVEVTEWPTETRVPRGRVAEVLGRQDDFGVDVEMVIRKHQLPRLFPEKVLEEARSVAHLDPAIVAARRDFRDRTIVTIDGETARDFDDAVEVRELADGTWELDVHIADVAEYVQPATALDLEARLRGTSVYFPDRAIPMLPQELSSDICSLRPNQDRLVLSCLMQISADGHVTGYEVCEGVIRSARRMTYTQVAAIIAPEEGDADDAEVAAATAGQDPTATATLEAELVANRNAGFALSPLQQPADAAAQAAAEAQRKREHREANRAIRAEFAPLVPHFQRMERLARLLNKKRHQRGSIDFDLPEPSIQFDEHGAMQSVTRSIRNWAHRLIEEFMLSANESVASWLSEHAPALYRIHEKPDPKRILDFEDVAAGFGYSLGIGNLPVKRFTMKHEQRESQHKTGRDHRARSTHRTAHEVPEDLPVTPQMYQRLAQKIAGKPEERILAFLMLRSLKQARYSEENEGHFALATSFYTHFTSPIRRYPDLIVHRVSKALLRSGISGQGSPRTGAPEEFRIAGDGGLQRVHGQDAYAHADKRAPRHKREASAPDVSQSTPRPTRSAHTLPNTAVPIPMTELAAIASESSDAERRADAAERELVEWKKIRFMASHVGEQFTGLILSATKYGLFVELNELFVEGLVPIQSLGALDGDQYSYRENTREIIGETWNRRFRMGQSVQVQLEHVNAIEKRLQFGIIPGEEEAAAPSRFAKFMKKGPKPPKKTKAKRKSMQASSPKSRIPAPKGTGKKPKRKR
ncbi:ribonuclease R family protein [Acidipila sp. EB88]|uniref:ribonuclease R family protein n=1 Tax=Acidipila sp. EB88 TaxID=2305226 RepID=UPI001F2B1352|nr:RNB domain-containing ribonuclease [Acidipila sp. EB88]